MTMEQRTALPRSGDFSTRDETGELRIEGYFSVFGSTYELWPGACETVEPGAFDGTLGGDIRALCNHDTALVLGRTSAGTLELHTDERGLFGSILINPDDRAAMDLYARVKRGDVTQCSFGFDILDQNVETDGEHTVWHIRKVKLYEVSVVTFPAYEDTGVQARQRDWEDIKQKQALAWRSAMLAKLRREDH